MTQLPQRHPNVRLPRTTALRTALGHRLPRPGARIGLLGGSFNPAHQGHRFISLVALKRLGLDEIWWLVSPQNPLKSAKGMAPLPERAKQARQIAARAPIRISTIESHLGTCYTADTCARLVQSLPEARFLWLMGADNLAQIDSWTRWTEIFTTLPVAIFDRPTYSLRAVTSKAARRFGTFRVQEEASRDLVWLRPPAWVFMRQPLNPLSATQIRARQEPDTA